MATYQRGEDYAKYLTIRDFDNNLYDPDSVTLTIESPCGNVLHSGSVASDSTGKYHTTYTIPTDAPFGEYLTTVDVVDGGETTILPGRFYVMPWDIIGLVRITSGITSKKSISDDDIAAIVWQAFKEALDDVYTYHHRERPKPNPDTGAMYDGTNTTFELCANLADYDGDGTVTGYYDGSCCSDVKVEWRDTDGNCHLAKVTITDTECGQVEITQKGGAAIPNTAQWVRASYHTKWESFNLRLFKKAVLYLAAHECILRFQELDRATLADIMSNKTVILADPNRMKKEYISIIRKIRKPRFGGSMLSGE